MHAKPQSQLKLLLHSSTLPASVRSHLFSKHASLLTVNAGSILHRMLCAGLSAPLPT